PHFIRAILALYLTHFPFFATTYPPARSTLFPYTTLFRSGVGYPGWHIECSGISMKYNGEYLDLHCGGIDNAFPHHTNEIAQSESDRKSTRLNSSHVSISYAVFCLKKKNKQIKKMQKQMNV